jgi:hypothetical protein
MRALLVLCLVLAGCVLDLPDDPARACDDLHPCEDGRVCVQAVCAVPDAGSP